MLNIIELGFRAVKRPAFCPQRSSIQHSFMVSKSNGFPLDFTDLVQEILVRDVSLAGNGPFVSTYNANHPYES
jgi:hypothetical protein